MRVERRESVQLSAAGGIDTWTGGGGGALELRAGAWSERTVGRLRWGAASASFVEVGTFPAFDLHSVSGWVDSAGRIPLGVGGQVRGASLGASRNLQVAMGPRLARHSAAARRWVQLGPLVRVGDHPAAGGLQVWASASRRLGSGQIGVGGDAQWLPAGDLPALTGELTGWSTMALGPGVLGVTVGAAGTSSATVPVGNAPAPGSVVGRAESVYSLPVRRNLALRGTVGADIGAGAVRYTRWRAMFGATFWLQAEARPEPVSDVAGKKQFFLFAPAGTDVRLTGEWSSWVPVPMTRLPDGWWGLEVDVPVGRWQYAYLVDGVPLPPPESEVRIDDGFGGTNGVIAVQ